MKPTLGITGVTGLIGSRLRAKAEAAGWSVVGYSRKPQGSDRLFADHAPMDVSGLDALVNLAGESVFGLWTKEKKRRILESRGHGTRRVVDAILQNGGKPGVLVNASAIGFYGETGEEIVDESSPPGSGFLAEVTRAWEAEALRAEAAGIRVVRVRIGMVLAPEGGAVKLMRPVFLAGLGGNLGNGRQWMSCIHVDDVAGILLAAASHANYSGAVNAVMPEAVRNSEFTQGVARAVHRPAILPAPAFAIRLALGELSGLLLSNIRVRPKQTQEFGYTFQYPELPAALRDVFA